MKIYLIYSYIDMKAKVWEIEIPYQSDCSLGIQSTYSVQCVCEFSCLVMSGSLQPHGLLLIRLLCQWNLPGKSTGMGCISYVGFSCPRDWTCISFVSWIFRQTLHHHCHLGSPLFMLSSTRLQIADNMAPLLGFYFFFWWTEKSLQKSLKWPSQFTHCFLHPIIAACALSVFEMIMWCVTV